MSTMNTTITTPKKFNPKYTIYRANDKDLSRGSAIFWEFAPKQNKIFIGAAKQKTLPTEGNDNATFDWQNVKQMSLDLIDLGAILGFIRHREPMGGGKGLFHKNAKGNSIVNFEKYKEETGRVIFNISFKIGDEVTRFSQLLNTAELMVIEQFIIKYMHEMFDA